MWSTAVAWRTTLAQTFNSCFIIMIANVVIDGASWKDKIWLDGGYASDARNIMMVNIIVHPVITAVHPQIWLKKFYRWRIRKNNGVGWTQTEAN